MNVFSGVCASAITPHREESHEADVSALLDLVDFLGRSGAQSICLLGSTGEFLNIPFDDRIRLVHLGVKRSRVPVLAGVSHSTLDGALELASEAFNSDAAGLLVMPPYFFRYQQEEVLEFFLRFAAGAPRRIPIFLYNIPAFTTPIEFATAQILLAGGRYAGIKDSSGDRSLLAHLLALKRDMDFTLLVGNDNLFVEGKQGGADGCVSGCASAVPELLVALDQAITSGDAARQSEMETLLQQFIGWIEKFPVPVGVKTAVATRGLKTGPLSLPLSPSKTAMLEEFRGWLSTFLPALPNMQPKKRK